MCEKVKMLHIYSQNEIIKKYNSASFLEKVNKLTANFSTSNVHTRSFIF